MNRFSKKSLDITQTVTEELAMATAIAMAISKVDFKVVEGYRTEKRQAELYAQGRTTKGEIVTYKDGKINKSKHQSGRAVDIQPINGTYEEVAEAFEKAGNVLGIKITWGGDWPTFKDKPHFEV